MRSEYLVKKKNFIFYDLQRFSAADEGRTELPSERRRREERERGNVPRSQEIVSAAVLVGGITILFFSGKQIYGSIQNVFQFYLNLDFSSTAMFTSVGSIRHFILDIGVQVAKIVAPILTVGIIMGLAGNIFQFGLLFTMYPLGIRWQKIRPDFRRILPGRRTLFSLGKVLLQVVFISGAAYVVIVDDYTPMLKTADMGLSQAIFLFARVAFKLLVIAAFVLALVSIPDFLYQRFEYIENLKVTFSEAKREKKDEEGDQLIRQRQRDRAYEMRKQQSMLQEVTTADVLVTNPTHFAVGLKYKPSVSPAPLVVAKGSDHLAFIIRNIARENGVHIEENPPLARALYEEVEIGQEIPETLYRVVSLVFSRLSRFKDMGAKTGV